MINRVIVTLVMALIWAGGVSAQDEDLSWLTVTPRCAPGGLAVTFAARGSSWNSYLPREIVARTYDWRAHTAGAQIAGPATIDDDGVTVFAPLHGAEWVIFQFTDTGTLFGGFHLAEYDCVPVDRTSGYVPHGQATLGECALLNVDIAQRPDLAGAEYHVIDTGTGLTIISAPISAYGDISFLVVPGDYPDIATYRIETDTEFLYSVERQPSPPDRTPHCILAQVGAGPFRWK